MPSRSCFSAVALALACIGAHAQDYPSKPIRIVATYATGGTSDVTARLLAQHLASVLGQSVVVENRVGANGIVGTDYVAKSAADGYTLVMAASGHAINKSLNPNVPYDPIRDFSFITLVGTIPQVVTANQSFPANSLAELIALARQKPGAVNYGSGGPGSSNQLSTELFAHVAGISLNHIAYKGDGPAVVDLVAGQIGFVFLNTPVSLPLLKGGRTKALAITSAKRSALLPDVPTVAETFPGFLSGSWQGIFAPAGVPQPIVSRLNTELVKIIRSPKVSEQLATWGYDIVANSPQECEAFVKAEIVKWADIIKTAKIKL